MILWYQRARGFPRRNPRDVVAAGGDLVDDVGAGCVVDVGSRRRRDERQPLLGIGGGHTIARARVEERNADRSAAFVSFDDLKQVVLLELIDPVAS
ncbi:MAG: hypothetical protein HQ582_24585 [Planctomycetes bacterium]|nr:hypothetical protein [Planctomycetota bacterium]